MGRFHHHHRGRHHKADKEFEFTAFGGADILADGDASLGRGDSFSMPISATTNFTVTDNDNSLSGDARRNEQGDDRRGQTAAVETDGVDVATDVKIYAEQFHILRDENGKRYILIEIEVAGQGANDSDDFFAFYGRVPPPGATLTVVGGGNVRGDFLKYDKLSAGLNWNGDADGKITIEAEDMNLSGYRGEDVNAASGGEVIKLKRGEGEASLTFGAESGVYDVEVSYVDESDGQGAIEVLVNDEVVQVIELTADTDGRGGRNASISTVTIDNLSLSQSDEITLRGARDGNEFARIDALTFCPDNPPDAADDAFTVAQGSLTAFNLLDNDSDQDGDALTLETVNGFANIGVINVTSDGGRAGTVTFQADGVLIFDTTGSFDELAAGQTDTVTLTYTVSDPGGQVDIATVTITVEGENDAPVANADLASVSEDAFVSVSLLDNDTDIDIGDELRVVSVNDQPAGAGFTVTSDGGRVANVTFDEGGELTFASFGSGDGFNDLAVGETDIVTLTYIIEDSEGAQASSTVIVTVDGENDAPAAEDVIASVSETDADGVSPGTVVLAAVASDVDASDTLEFSVDDSGAAGSVVNNGDGTFTYSNDGLFDLAAGQIATDSFEYIVSDGNGGVDTATATVTIIGEGDAVVEASSTAATPNTGQDITVSLSADSTTADGAATVAGDINFGAVIQPNINVVYVVDTSGSTIASVLEEEVAALQALTANIAAQGFPDGSVTISIVPFSTVSGPDATGDDSSTFILDASDDAGGSDVDDVNAALADLNGGGFTNYVAALEEAHSVISGLDPAGEETNVVFFLSDGQPTVRDLSTGQIVTQTEAEIAAAAAPLQAVAQISGFEIGNVNALEFLNALDNTGGAVSVESPEDLSAALVGSPIPNGAVIDAELLIFDEAGAGGGVIQTFAIDVPGEVDDPAVADLLETPFGLELDMAVSGLDADLGDGNRLVLSVQFDDDGDGVVDLTLQAEVDVFGIA